MAQSPTFGVQLYSGRKFPPVEAQLATIARYGFNMSRPSGRSMTTWRRPKGCSTRMVSARRADMSALRCSRTNPTAIEIARQLGIEFVVAPYLTASRTSDDGRRAGRRSGARLAQIEARLSSAGLRFAWHNHDFEFRPLADGSLPIEHLLGDRLLWEADLAWVDRAAGPTRGTGWSAIAAAFRWFMSRISHPQAKMRTRTAGLTSERASCPGPNSGRSASRRAPRS